MTTWSGIKKRVKAFSKWACNSPVAGAYAFLVFAISLDGATTLVAVNGLGAMESNPFMRDFFGNMLWRNFFVIQFEVLALNAAVAGLLLRLTKIELLPAIYLTFTATGNLAAALNNTIVITKLLGVL